MDKLKAMRELNATKERNEAIVEIDEYSTGYKSGFEDALEDALFLVEKIDVEQKPVVPQCVANWYEEHKVNLPYEIYELCVDYANNGYDGEFYDWFKANLNGAIETLVKMKLYDYKVKEKLYQVEVPSNMAGRYYALVKDRTGTVVLGQFDNDLWKALDSTKLTEKEIKKDYAWTWGLHFNKEVEE